MLKITSKDVLDFKIINGVIAEPANGAHTDPKATAESLKSKIIEDLSDLITRNPSVLVKYRNKKIRKFGCITED